MGCCVLAVMIVGQIFEGWRRLKVFFGFSAELYPDPAAVPAAVRLGDRLRLLLRKRAIRIALAFLLASEATLASAWLYTEHKDHLYSAAAAVAPIFGIDVPSTSICSASNAVAAALPAQRH